MEIIKLQIVILVTIISSGILGGKKGAIIAGAVWLVASIIMMHSNIFAVIQFITVTVSYQISILIGIGRDYYIKRKNVKIQGDMIVNKK